MLMYSCYNPYIQILSGKLINKFGFTKESAGPFFALPALILLIGCPLFGFLLDKIGRRPLFIIAAGLLFTAAHLISIALPTCNRCYYEAGPLAILGLAWSIYLAVIFGCIALVVKPEVLGTAFGLNSAV